MTGYYRIVVPRYPARIVSFERRWQTKQIETDYDRRLKAAWHRFHVLCSSLYADGLTYELALNLNAEQPHVLITASGKAKARKRYQCKTATLPPPVTVAKCRQRIGAIEHYQTPARERGWRTPNLGNTYANECGRVASEHLHAELEYWREMERLSGQREHFKPGLNDDNRYSDDEVAA